MEDSVVVKLNYADTEKEPARLVAERAREISDWLPRGTSMRTALALVDAYSAGMNLSSTKRCWMKRRSVTCVVVFEAMLVTRSFLAISTHPSGHENSET